MAISESRTVTVKTARKSILRAFSKQRPVFLWGAPGVGKSDLIASIAEELGGALIDVRLATCEPTDIRGIPILDKNTNKMIWAEPAELPSEEFCKKYPIVVLFLDELSACPSSLQVAAYQLILNRRIGTYKLPDNVVVIAAGNRDSDKGVSYRMSSALANRFIHLTMTVSADDWIEWAVQNKVHKDVVGFISFAKQDLYDFDPRSSGHAFATPRSWHFVSQLLEDGDDETNMDLISGTIGEGMAMKFMAHRRISGDMPAAADILSGKVTELKIKEISAMYSLTVSMLYELKDNYDVAKKEDDMSKWYPQGNHFIKFILDNFTTELAVMGARMAMATYKLPFSATNMPSMTTFTKKYSKYIILANS